MKEFAIAGRKIGPNNPCFIVAEMSGNHNQDFGKAVKIVEAAADARCNAIKLQTYTPDTLTLNSNKPWFMERGEGNPEGWKGKSLYELYQSAYTPWDWHPKLQKIAHDLGLIFFSTPFDDTAVDFLENLNVPCYKIAAYEATDMLLLRKVASTGKPVIMSVGFSTKEEVKFGVETLRKYGAKDIAILHCLTTYSDNPDPSNAHLRTMLDLRDNFDVVCGFSDNNSGIEIPLLAAMAGASIIEKHLILDKLDEGPDSQFSLDPKELKEMVKAIRRDEKAMGEIYYGPRSEGEKENLRFRRSLFVVKDMRKGEKFTGENVKSIRPANGLETKFYDEVIGKIAKDDIEKGTPLSWSLIEGENI